VSGTGLRVEVEANVATLTLNRPDERNAINEALHAALESVWGELEARADVRAVILTGAGRAFSAGGNLEGFRRLVDDRAVRRFMMDSALALAEAIAGFRKPIVAAVNGPAVGLGASLVGLCDIVLMAERAYFADTHVSVGLVSGDGATSTWPLMVGILRAKEKILLGERIDAATAVAIGMATRAVPDEELMAEARTIADRLAAQPPQALQDTKRVLNLHIQDAIRRIMPTSLAWESESFDAPDVSAFIERHAR
jgi:enoyl-CoA hydratase/carnithine racemase